MADSLYMEGYIEHIEPEKKIFEGFSKIQFLVCPGGQDQVVFEVHKNVAADNLGLISPFDQGDNVRVYYSSRARQHKGNYYDNFVAYRIESI